MGPPIATMASSTSHNGTPSSSASKTKAKGNFVLRIGDHISCPIHGDQTITTGSSNSKCEGSQIARVGDSTSCGATLTVGTSLTDQESKILVGTA